jgi:hypothetical protein
MPLSFKHTLAAAALALAAAAASPLAAAQSCAGFSDVSATDPLCPNVEWLKNRSITLGCAAGLYCPNEPVNRLAMAAFMNRLGTALTPAFVRTTEDPGAADLAAPRQFCKTTATPITGFPRTALVMATFNPYAPQAGIEIEARIVYSTDGGATWNPSPASDGYAFVTLEPGRIPPDDGTVSMVTALDFLLVGNTYQFAVEARRLAGSGSAVVNVYCENLVQLMNRNGGSPPYDVQPATAASSTMAVPTGRKAR